MRQNMKKNLTRILTPTTTLSLTSFLITLALTGCVVSGGNRVPGTSYAATSPKKIALLYQEPKRPYEVVGFVSVARALADKDSVIERKFRTVAATMGADAVLIEMLPKASYFGAPVQGKAKAIRWM
jgi:hypothetical protein